MKVTQLEKDVLIAFANSEYQNDSENPLHYEVWGGWMYVGHNLPKGSKVTERGLGGIMASLQDKGMIKVTSADCDGVDRKVRPSSQVSLLEPCLPFIANRKKKN